MATKLPNNTFNLADGSFTLGDGEDAIGTGLIGGDDVFLGAANLPTGGYVAFGDTWSIYGTGRGGNDRFVAGAKVGTAAEDLDDLLWGWGGEDGGVVFIGDAGWIYDNGAGGNDLMTAGNNTAGTYFGDGEDMYGHATGGKDTIKGSNSATSTSTEALASSLVAGDAWYAYGEDTGEDSGVTGGADVLSGGNATSSGTGASGGHAGNLNAVFGDFYYMYNDVRGGNDSIVGGNASARGGSAEVVNWLVGDGADMEGSSGGNDIVKGGAVTLTGNGYSAAYNLMSGDAMFMDGYASAGNDSMTGGGASDGATSDGYAFALNLIAGDTWDIGYFGEDDAVMGHDKVTGGSAITGADGYVVNVIYGDVGDMDDVYDFMDEFGGGGEDINGFSIGLGGAIDYGNDSLTGGSGNAANFLMGDAPSIGDGYAETGGNDTLTGGGLGSYNELIGDSWWIGEDGGGGNDKLISGAGEDYMVGDAESMSEFAEGGADIFVFKFGNGNDWIEDFRVSDGDRIDISAMRTIIGSYAKLLAQNRLEYVEEMGSTILHLDRSNPASDNNTVVLYGVHPDDLSAAQFIF